MKKKILGGIAAAAAAVGLAMLPAGTANAAVECFSSTGVTQFVCNFKGHAPYVFNKYGEAAVVAEGNKVCGWNAQGLGTSAVIDLIVADMPMSRKAALS